MSTLAGLGIVVAIGAASSFGVALIIELIFAPRGRQWRQKNQFRQ